MPTWGLTSTGFLAKPAAQIESEIDTALQQIVGASAATEPDGTIPNRSLAGQIKVFLTDGFAAMWDLQQALYSAFDANAATGVAEDNLGSLTGTIRNGGNHSTVVATCCGTPGTVLPFSPLPRTATVTGTGTRFDSEAIATITALTAWAQSTPYNVGDRRTANSNCYQCTQAGTSSNTGTGPSGTTYGLNINDGTAEWVYIGQGTGAVDVNFIAEQEGALAALANTLVTIATPVDGWKTVTNLIAATVGTLEETDAAYRVRRAAELAASGKGTPEAIRAAVLAVNAGSQDPLHLPITSCSVYYNDTDVTDGNGLPPHSVECVVYYNLGVSVTQTDQDIANAIFAAVGAGIATHGTTTSTVTDSQGNAQTINWTKPTEVDIYVVGTVYYDASQWPATGAAALVQQAALSALLTFAEPIAVGHSVRSAPLAAAILEGPSALDTTGAAVVPAPSGSSAAPGILDVTPLNIGTSPAPGTSTPITIGTRQVARFTAANVTLTATAEAP